MIIIYRGPQRPSGPRPRALGTGGNGIFARAIVCCDGLRCDGLRCDGLRCDGPTLEVLGVELYVTLEV